MSAATAARPTALPVVPEGVPAKLRNRDQWVTWRYEWDAGRGEWTKVPYIAGTAHKASSTNPTTWRPFAVALAAYEAGGRDGLGFVVTAGDGFVGFDFDHCRDPDSGALDPAVAADVAALDSYAEVSPSGSGVRAFVAAAGLPEEKDGRHPAGTGVFASGRYLTVTGQRLPGAPATINDRQDALAAFYARRFPSNGHRERPRAPTGPSRLTDAEVIAKARAAANGDKFDRLFLSGDPSGYASDSEADLGLLSLLTFWTQDADQLDRLFRRSGLMRPKWEERPDYRTRTIRKALERTEVYEPGPRVTIGRNGRDPAAGAGGADADAEEDKTETEPVVESRTLAEVMETFRRWLYLPDDGSVYVSLATVAANLLDSDPVWTLIVGPSSGGKTETINAVARALPYAHLAATLTEAALLSGTPKREKATDSRGGLLRLIGDFGILILKDFTSILSMNRDQRAQLLAALREIYDGDWTRHVGSDGGRTLHWAGKLGLVAGCTAAIDSHHAVMAVMGERFILYRLPAIDPEKQADRALANAGRERVMREELTAAVCGLFAGLDIGAGLPPIDAGETAALVALSSLVASARSAVERDAYKRDIELVLDTEAPARLAQTLRRLYAGLLAIGLDRRAAWPLVAKAGLDCIPKLRRSVFDVLLATTEWRDSTEIATTVGYPSTTARRSLEDLAVHGVVVRQSGGRGKADRWRLSDLARARHAATFPEMSDAGNRAWSSLFNNPNPSYDDISGTPQNLASPCGESGENSILHCWACKEVIVDCERCEACGWLICACGACSPECQTVAGEAGDDPWTNA